MTEPTFMTDEGFATIKTMHRLRTVLQREGKGYLRALHCRCGVGLTNKEFDSIVNTLAKTEWCSIQEGAQGAKLVVFNQQIRDSYVPEVPNNEND
jgi:hypothetical protein